MYIPSQTSLPLSLKRSFIIVFSLSTLIGYGALVFAVAPPPGPGGYLPGTVLDPGCLPGESIAEGDAYDCFVQTSSGGSIVPTNGLSPIGGNSIGLGGELGEATTIDRNGHDFSITNGNMFMGGINIT